MEKILVLDLGGTHSQLIARRVRDCHVYSEILHIGTPLEKIISGGYKGIIFAGSNERSFDAVPIFDKKLFDLGIPIMGICHSARLIVHMLGGKISKIPETSEGRVSAKLQTESPIFAGLQQDSDVYVNYSDDITSLPAGFSVCAEFSDGSTAAVENRDKNIFALQFHPEDEITEEGTAVFRNFLYNVCGCTGQWTMEAFVENQISTLREKVGDSTVLCALSGGVDSAVAALMLHKAIGDQLTCIFVDHGLLRKNEADEVEQVFAGEYNMKLIRINAEERFLARLEGVTEPEQKRKIIGEEFIRVFEEEAKKIGQVDYLVQGTIYPDIVESGVGDAALVKSHHNVGGLPDHVDFKEIIEPLRDLFKDEVRKAGIELGMPESLVWRQPFPGPGLGVRVIGEINKFKLDILREADYIFRDEIMKAGLHRSVSQYFAVLTDMKSVGVRDGKRTYDYILALRAVKTVDFMTAKWCKIPFEVLEAASERIGREVRGISRVVYDITPKPPATIEWE